jgi:hypothetical protein
MVSSIQAQDEIYTIEGFGGYSYMNLNRGVDPEELPNVYTEFPGNRVNAHGFNGSLTYNFNRYIGAKFDVTLHTHGEDFTTGVIVTPTTTTNTTLEISQSVYQYMGGIQFKDNSKEGSAFRPFFHVLGGIAAQNLSLDEVTPVNRQIFEYKANDFAMKIGGGADLKVHKNFSIRMIQFDYNPIFRGDIDYGNGLGTGDAVIQHNYLVSFGGVFHF